MDRRERQAPLVWGFPARADGSVKKYALAMPIQGIPRARGRKVDARIHKELSEGIPRARTEGQCAHRVHAGIGGFPARADGSENPVPPPDLCTGIPRARGRKRDYPAHVDADAGDSPRARTEGLRLKRESAQEGGFPARADGRLFNVIHYANEAGIPRARGRKSRTCETVRLGGGDSPRARTEAHVVPSDARRSRGFPARADGSGCRIRTRGVRLGIPRARGRKRVNGSGNLEARRWIPRARTEACREGDVQPCEKKMEDLEQNLRRIERLF